MKTTSSRRCKIGVFVLASIFCFQLATHLGGAEAAPPTAEQVCASSTWANCGLAVKQAIQALPEPLPADKLEQLVAIMTAWGDAYEKRVRELEASGGLTRSESDWSKITNEVKDQINPIEIGKDKIKDKLLKKYLPKVAAFLEYAQPVFGGLKAFFTESEIATDFDELNLMNEDLQKRFFQKVEPHLQADYRQRLETMSAEVLPQLKPR